MKHLLRIMVVVLLSAGFIVNMISCKKRTLPVVTTENVSGITQTSAVSGGNVTNNGGDDVTARGICWSTSPSPVTSSNKTSDGTGNGVFTSSITSLTANTTYHVRAYANNGEGTGYGNEILFTTSPVPLATLTTTAISSITSTTAVSGGTITDDGGETITARGVCWNTSSNPTTANYITSDGTGTGSFTSNLANLQPGITYYLKAYATNSGGTAYANNEVTFTTSCLSPSSPMVGTITQPTCAVATGSVALSGLPSTGTWTLTRTAGGTTTPGTGTSTTISGLAAGTYTFTVTDASGCVSAASGNVVINTQPATPSSPVVGTITQPTCALATGSVALSGLPSTGTWTLTRTPGGITTTGTGTSNSISGLAAGTYSFTVTDATGCISAASGNVVITTPVASPSSPVVGTITQPTCALATGSVSFSGLPTTGTWTLTRSPGGIATTGTGTGITVSALSGGTYTFTVTDGLGCISAASGNVVINTQPATPLSPVVGTITQPTCSVATGSVALGGLPSTGTWTLTRTPGGTTTTGTGISNTISGLAAGTYTFTVTNASGCISAASGNVVINAQPAAPSAPVVGTITQPCSPVTTGSVILSGLPSTGTWTLTRTPGGTTYTGTGTSTTVTGLPAGTTYTFTVSNSSGCVSTASGNILILQPPTPSLATTNAATNIGTTNATFNGSVNANGSSTTVTFDYGLTTSFGSTITAAQSPVTGSSNTAVSAVVSGLAANTLYYYRVKAVNCGGTLNGSTSYFTTRAYSTDGLISYFNFDGNLKDMYGNTPDGVNYGGATFTSGKASSAITLNGINQYIQFGRKTYKSGNNISVALWFLKPNTTEALKYFIMCSDFGIWTESGSAGIAIWLPSTSSASGTIAQNTWVHLVGTYDGTNIRVYINSVLVKTTSWPGNISDPDRYLTLGFFSSSYWGGSIDDLFIYNRVLNQTDINQLYHYH